jgi:hypothetical protein
MGRQQMGKGKEGYNRANGQRATLVILEHGRAPPRTAARRKKEDVALVSAGLCCGRASLDEVTRVI